MLRAFNFVPGEHYHIFNRGVEKRPIFLNPEDWDRFHSLLYLANTKKPLVLKMVQGDPFEWNRGERITTILAYSLISNHFHIICREDKAGGISKLLAKTLTSYSMYFNTKYERSGPLFCRPFRARHIDNDSYFRWVFSYTHLNPLSMNNYALNELKSNDSQKAFAFLRSFKYSSYPDYFGAERREAKILNMDALPTDISDLENIEKIFATAHLLQGESLE